MPRDYRVYLDDIHEYFGTDVEIIWDVVQNKIPLLEQQVRRLLSE